GGPNMLEDAGGLCDEVLKGECDIEFVKKMCPHICRRLDMLEDGGGFCDEILKGDCYIESVKKMCPHICTGAPSSDDDVTSSPQTHSGYGEVTTVRTLPLTRSPYGGDYGGDYGGNSG
ncbi:unnamed protein product, partial [Meganyctiphanes norvegica]